MRLCRVIETSLSHDQLVIGEQASYEYLARQLQSGEGRVVEARERGSFLAPMAKAQAKDANSWAASPTDYASEFGHFLGMGETKGNLCITPTWMDSIADQMKDESAVAKERRKAREMRALPAP